MEYLVRGLRQTVMKKKLTITTAKRIGKSYYGKVKDRKLGEFLLVHVKAVAKTAQLLAQNKKVDRELLEIAAWVHDIGYAVQHEGHGALAVTLLQEQYTLSPTLRDCILEHSGDGRPKTLAGKIIQAADKISIFDCSAIEVFLKHSHGRIGRGTVAFLRNKMTKEALDFLENWRL